MTPKFIIGIGSQRAGSTLLHRILSECTDIFMHPVKELHYYDTLYGIRNASVLKQYSKKQLDREIDRLIEAKGYGYINKEYKCYLRANKILSRSPIEQVDYLDLYRPCILGNQYLGEITPEYMILPEEGVAQMSRDLGRDTKIILISRDPVQRFISAFKLLKFYGNHDYDMAQFTQDLEVIFEQMPTWIEQQKQLSDYETALHKYLRHFDNVLLLHYEEMIGNFDQLRKTLENFLSLPIDKEKFETVSSQKTNQIQETNSLSPELLSKIEQLIL